MWEFFLFCWISFTSSTLDARLQMKEVQQAIVLTTRLKSGAMTSTSLAQSYQFLHYFSHLSFKTTSFTQFLTLWFIYFTFLSIYSTIFTLLLTFITQQKSHNFVLMENKLFNQFWLFDLLIWFLKFQNKFKFKKIS